MPLNLKSFLNKCSSVQNCQAPGKNWFSVQQIRNQQLLQPKKLVLHPRFRMPHLCHKYVMFFVFFVSFFVRKKGHNDFRFFLLLQNNINFISSNLYGSGCKYPCFFRTEAEQDNEDMLKFLMKFKYLKLQLTKYFKMF